MPKGIGYGDEYQARKGSKSKGYNKGGKMAYNKGGKMGYNKGGSVKACSHLHEAAKMNKGYKNKGSKRKMK